MTLLDVTEIIDAHLRRMDPQMPGTLPRAMGIATALDAAGMLRNEAHPPVEALPPPATPPRPGVRTLDLLEDP